MKLAEKLRKISDGNLKLNIINEYKKIINLCYIMAKSHENNYVVVNIQGKEKIISKIKDMLEQEGFYVKINLDLSVNTMEVSW